MDQDPHLQLAEDGKQEQANLALNLVHDLEPHKNKFNAKSREFLQSLIDRWQDIDPSYVYVSSAQYKWLLDLADQAKIVPDGTRRDAEQDH